MKKLLLSILITSLVTTSSASALSPSLFNFFAKNGIYYYNPDGYSNGCFVGLGSYDGVVSAGLSALQSAFVDKYHTIAIQLSSEYGIPWEAVMAQGILESTSGTSKYAVERNNFFGINAVDSNPDKATSFSTPQEGWKGYYEFIKNNSRYARAGAFNYPNDPYGYIQAIKNAGYATDPNYVAKVSGLIKAIQNRASERNWLTSLVTTVSNLLHGCSSTTYGNGDLNSTALALSWPDRSHSLTDAKSSYTSALSAVGLANYGDKFVQIGASCDAFVATVLRFSGLDPNVKCCGALNMLNYFINSDLYEEIPNLGNTSNLQAGDIRAKASHVEMYVIDENGNGKIASASYGDRTSDHAINYYPDSAYRIFRFKGVKI
ncbi:glucosaminidase domain-containing protein [Candidatus Saccharibacteria bacterium]|nr:glucosaminidase domain-containing protein [Candidatus Saccharibacteria bacterium]